MQHRFVIQSLLVLIVSANFCQAEDVSSSFDAKGVKIHYTIHGSGTPVVLIHGLYSTGDINWGMPGIISALAKDHQVIALDMPGHGKSDKPQEDKAYGEQMVEDVVLLMDHLKIKKAHVIGYSMGGMTAAKMLTTHPDRMISCILGGWGFMKEGTKAADFWEKLGNGDNKQAPRAGARLGGGGRMGGDRSVPPACVHGFTRLAITEEQLKAVKVPVEVLVGDRDMVKAMYVKPLQEVRKDWPVVEIKDAGHITCIMKPEFKEEIVKWVGGHDHK